MAEVDVRSGFRRCEQCGTLFHCGASDCEPCWCASLPPLPAERLLDGESCVCETCLRARLPRPESNR